MRVNELDVNVVVGNVLSCQFFDDCAHVGDAFFGQVGQAARCVNFSTAALRGRDQGFDGEHDAAEIGKA